MEGLKWVAGTFVGVLVLGVARDATSRLMGASAEQERALRLMRGGVEIGDSPAPVAPEAGHRQARRDFDQGRRHTAFDRVCGGIVAQRGAGVGARDLLGYFSAARAVQESASLFAQMLARSPADEPLPPTCEEAFAPPRAEELSLCEAFRGTLAQTLEVPPDLFFDPTMTDARMATGFARTCGTDPLQLAVVQDRPLPPLSPSPRFGFDCIGNPTGCLLVDMALPAYDDYVLRAQEHGARMRLASTVYWLHGRTDDTLPLAERLAARPATMHSPGHPVEVAESGAALRIPTLGPRGGHWQLPLAPSH